MTLKQKAKVATLAETIFNELSMGSEIFDEHGNKVVGLRFNPLSNPNSWSYCFNSKSSHLILGAILTTDSDKDVLVSKKFTIINDAGKSRIVK